MGRYTTVSLLAILFLPLLNVDCRVDSFLRMQTDEEKMKGGDAAVSTRWAVLIAGSNGYGNYRHQADICHAYHVMKNGGLKDENIVVFMYDDIAYSKYNPVSGIIINQPGGGDVYAGVPKDYIGEDVNTNNFLAVILGNKTALTGGSGKVVDSGPDDHIFIYYSDHGGPGVLGMPNYPHLYADKLNSALKEKHEMGTYKSTVIYLEACESGSIFDGLLPKDINIYATTAANTVESSWGTYCPSSDPRVPKAYWACLGDLYSVAWMEDSDKHNLRTESLDQQYNIIKTRTSDHNTYAKGSHVMQYGNLELDANQLFQYIGSNPANDNSTFIDDNTLPSFSMSVNQRDADLVFYWHKFQRSPEGSAKKQDAQRQLLDVMNHRLHVDNSIELVVKLLFGSEKGVEVMKTVRPPGQALVDDWDCLKSMVRSFEKHCGSLSQYGMKHMRSLANICNAGIKTEKMAEVAAKACISVPSNPWSSLHKGYSA